MASCFKAGLCINWKKASESQVVRSDEADYYNLAAEFKSNLGTKRVYVCVCVGGGGGGEFKIMVRKFEYKTVLSSMQMCVDAWARVQLGSMALHRRGGRADKTLYK